MGPQVEMLPSKDQEQARNCPRLRRLLGGLGFGVWGFGLRVKGLGFRVQGSGFRV